MTNIIIGDIAEGQKWYGQVEFMKQQLANNHRSNNAFMSTWKQLSPDVKVFIKMVAGKPQAFIYALVDDIHCTYPDEALVSDAFIHINSITPILKPDYESGHRYWLTTTGDFCLSWNRTRFFIDGKSVAIPDLDFDYLGDTYQSQILCCAASYSGAMKEAYEPNPEDPIFFTFVVALFKNNLDYGTNLRIYGMWLDAGVLNASQIAAHSFPDLRSSVLYGAVIYEFLSDSKVLLSSSFGGAFPPMISNPIDFGDFHTTGVLLNDLESSVQHGYKNVFSDDYSSFISEEVWTNQAAQIRVTSVSDGVTQTDTVVLENSGEVVAHIDTHKSDATAFVCRQTGILVRDYLMHPVGSNSGGVLLYTSTMDPYYDIVTPVFCNYSLGIAVLVITTGTSSTNTSKLLLLRGGEWEELDVYETTTSPGLYSRLTERYGARYTYASIERPTGGGFGQPFTSTSLQVPNAIYAPQNTENYYFTTGPETPGSAFRKNDSDSSDSCFDGTILVVGYTLQSVAPTLIEALKGTLILNVKTGEGTLLDYRVDAAYYPPYDVDDILHLSTTKYKGAP